MSEIQKTYLQLQEKRDEMRQLNESNEVVNKDGKSFHDLYQEYNEVFGKYNRLLQKKQNKISHS